MRQEGEEAGTASGESGPGQSQQQQLEEQQVEEEQLHVLGRRFSLRTGGGGEGLSGVLPPALGGAPPQLAILPVRVALSLLAGMPHRFLLLSDENQVGGARALLREPGQHTTILRPQGHSAEGGHARCYESN